jgi:DNA-binding HxlR family transcriptional regulator
MDNHAKYTRITGAESVSEALKFLEGRWKLLILFQLFGGEVVRFSQLERGVTGITQKMLSQQLRQLEKDGLVRRTAYNEVPPRVEYSLTEWGQALCPALDALLTWASKRS